MTIPGLRERRRNAIFAGDQEERMRNKWLGWVLFFGIIIGLNALRYFGVLDLGFWFF